MESLSLQDSYLNYQMLIASLYFVRKCAVGTVSFGLFMGAFYFMHYLYRLNQLDRNSREFRWQSEHMMPETLIRYAITIACMIILNLLFYVYFDFGKECTHAGIVIWLIYFAVKGLLNLIRTLRRGNYQKVDKNEPKDI